MDSGQWKRGIDIGDCRKFGTETMFGKREIFTYMAGNDTPSDSFNPSSSQNPNHNLITNLPFQIFPPQIPEQIVENGSRSDHVEGGASGHEHEMEEQRQAKKKRYHRHTTRQIEEMEALFRECQHPDDKQRQRLSHELGLKPRQVKFWFQNRRTQMKAQHDRADSVILRAENEDLRNENFSLQTALSKIVCHICGGSSLLGEIGFDHVQQLRLENARLKEEYDRVYSIFHGVRPIQGLETSSLIAHSLDLDMNTLPTPFEELHMPYISERPHFSSDGILILYEEKPLAMEAAILALEELLKMCRTGEPLWIRTKDAATEVLNVDEYARIGPCPMDVKPNLGNFRTEATRHNAVVNMNSITLIDAFIDANKWMELFPSVVARAKTLQVITSGVSGHASGSLQLMFAEFQVPSPLVPTREAHFLRYCHHNAEEGIWAIVDFPLENFKNNYVTPFPYYKRKPSGLIIQDMPNGYSRVTWVENVEIEENLAHHIFNNFVCSGMAFGAKRWLSVLRRQCERLASLMSRNISDLGVIPSPEARKNVMNLAQRMMRTFSVNISSANGQSWTALSGSADDTVRITTKKVSEPGQPNGLILTVVLTTWLPNPPQQVFDFLSNERRRSKLEVLSNGNSLHKVAHIAIGSHPGNNVSLLRINVASDSSQGAELMLQESSIDDSGSLVVYSMVDVDAVKLAMNGEDLSCIPLLPMGFLIHPSENGNYESSSSRLSGEINNAQPCDDLNAPVGMTADLYGCLFTVGLQVLVSSNPTAKLNLSSVTAINNHIHNTVHQITAALGNNHGYIGSNSIINGNIIASFAEPMALEPPAKID